MLEFFFQPNIYGLNPGVDFPSIASQEVLSSRSLRFVFIEARLNEFFGRFRARRGLVKLSHIRFVRLNLVVDGFLREAREWVEAKSPKLERHHAHGPDVNLFIVSLLFHKLWCHVVASANNHCLILAFSEFLCEAKIRKLDSRSEFLID